MTHASTFSTQAQLDQRREFEKRSIASLDENDVQVCRAPLRDHPSSRGAGRAALKLALRRPRARCHPCRPTSAGSSSATIGSAHGTSASAGAAPTGRAARWPRATRSLTALRMQVHFARRCSARPHRQRRVARRARPWPHAPAPRWAGAVTPCRQSAVVASARPCLLHTASEPGRKPRAVHQPRRRARRTQGSSR